MLKEGRTVLNKTVKLLSEVLFVANNPKNSVNIFCYLPDLESQTHTDPDPEYCFQRYVVWENFHDLQHQIEYPESNIPKRLNADEIIPADLKFHFHTDHIGTQYLTLIFLFPREILWFVRWSRM